MNTKGLKDGEYEAVAWHEKYDKLQGKITVKDGKGTVDFTFIIAAAQNPAGAHPSPAALAHRAEGPAVNDCCSLSETGKAIEPRKLEPAHPKGASPGKPG